MEGRRTRGRPKLKDPVMTAAALTEKISTVSTNINIQKKRSASKTKNSPARTRRSSKSHTTVVPIPASKTIQTNPSPIKETYETPSPKSVASKTHIPTDGSNLNTTGGRSSPHLTAKSTSSLHSSSSSTQKTIEIRSTASALDTEFRKLSDYIRRSVSKTLGCGGRREGTHTPTTNTDVESRSVSRSIFGDGASSKAEFSDNETIEEEEQDRELFESFNISTQQSYSTSALGWQNCRQLEIPTEFGGWAGATLLMIFVPPLVYYLQWCCQKNICELQMNLKMVRSSATWKSIFNNEAIAAFIVYQLGVFVLSALLFGRYVRLPTDRFSGVDVGSPRGTNNKFGVEYKFNALPIAIVITLAAGFAEYQGYPLADFILENQFRFCIYGFLNAFILALWAYMRSDMLKNKTTQAQLNVYGKTGNFLVDYALGRQLNPKWLNFVELKLVFYRVALLLTLLYAECYIYNQLLLPGISPSHEVHSAWTTLQYYYHNIHYDSASLLTSTMLLIYILDAIIFEHHLASSFELQCEGFGALLLLRYAATPYLLSAVARYFYVQQLGRHIHCCFAIYLPLILLFFGLLLKRFSSAIKYKYRVNPSNPYFLGIETIHTFQDRRLLLGVLWGRLRQPNYAGDLIALCALALPLFVRFAWPPLICLLLLCVVLVHRTQRVQARNQARYQSSWVRYCNKVRYFIFPKVY